MKYLDNDSKLSVKEVWMLILLAVCIMVIIITVMKKVISSEAGIILLSISTILPMTYSLFFKKP